MTSELVSMYLDERENYGEGTRQNHSVTSE